MNNQQLLLDNHNNNANNEVNFYPLHSLSHGLSISVTKICNDHPVFLIENFLTPDECDYIISFGESKLAPSTVVENDKLVIPSYRTSYTAFITDSGKYCNDNIIKKIQQRVSAFSWFPVQHMESFNLTRYCHNQKYDEHVDYFDQSHLTLLGNAKQRVCTFFVYLNDVPDDAGGHTIFPYLNLKIKPKKGNAVFWLNTDLNGVPYPKSRHLGEVITKENIIKYALNIWIRQCAF
jgi:prolyl 4-hydroxylase